MRALAAGALQVLRRAAVVPLIFPLASGAKPSTRRRRVSVGDLEKNAKSRSQHPAG
jgi:hypothetical protein